jgi:peptidoglycan/LPS O-acetylase OafA/YrhL
VLAASGIAFRVWALEGGWQVLGSPSLTLPAFLDWFALGMGLAVLSVWLRERPGLPAGLRWVDGRPGYAWFVAAVAFVASAAVADRLADGSTAENLSVHLLWGIVALGLLLPAVIGDRERGAVRGLMASATLAWLGLVSYGIYLWQGPIIRFVGDLTPLGEPSIVDTHLIWLVAAPPFVFLVAALSYYGLERPALSLKRLVAPPGVAPDQPGAVSAPSAPEAR